ncbi:cytochrome P450 [Nocardia sp. NPDC056064]|uniref:cytochrome P450 family protein n=1 Tax=Nocardia sp. NPDC056064 TaxID=3345701 RepID=UPI0035DD11E4
MISDSIHRLGVEFLQDPHTVYRRLNDEGPLHRVEFANGMQAWLVTGYDLAKEALLDERLSKDIYGPSGDATQAAGKFLPRLDPPVNKHLLYADPPRHTRLRKIAMKALSGRAVNDFTPRLRAIADELLDRAVVHETVDLLGAYAYPFAVTAICELIGISAAGRAEHQEWLDIQVSTASADEKNAAAAKFDAYVRRLIADRAGGGADLISELMVPDADGDRLDDGEIVAMVNALLLGSQETTAGLIGNAVLELVRRPGFAAELGADPALLTAFIEETLRFEGSGNIATYRLATEPIQWGGRTVDTGDIVLVGVAGANRDVARFDTPDELDLDRPDKAHLSFGYGIHRCAGAALARKEAFIALSALIERYPGIALADDAADLRWKSSLITRGLVALPVRLGTTESGSASTKG